MRFKLVHLATGLLIGVALGYLCNSCVVHSKDPVTDKHLLTACSALQMLNTNYGSNGFKCQRTKDNQIEINDNVTTITLNSDGSLSRALAIRLVRWDNPKEKARTYQDDMIKFVNGLDINHKLGLNYEGEYLSPMFSDNGNIRINRTIKGYPIFDDFFSANVNYAGPPFTLWSLGVIRGEQDGLTEIKEIVREVERDDVAIEQSIFSTDFFKNLQIDPINTVWESFDMNEDILWVVRPNAAYNKDGNKTNKPQIAYIFMGTLTVKEQDKTTVYHMNVYVSPTDGKIIGGGHVR